MRFAPIVTAAALFIATSALADVFSLAAIRDVPAETTPTTGEANWVQIHDDDLTTNAITGGASFVDFDGDGDLDVCWINADGGLENLNRLVRNDGRDFADVAGALAQTGDDRAATWADYDNDGDLDVCIGAHLGGHLFRHDGDAFVDVTPASFGDPVRTRNGVSWVDYDRDGDVDLFFANSGGASQLFRNDAGSFVEVTTGDLTNTDHVQHAAWGDYDGDGDQDVYLVAVAVGFKNRLFRNDGTADFVDVTPAILGVDDVGHGASWGDVDNDGDLDLYSTNLQGSNHLFLNEGNGAFSDRTSAPLEGTGLSVGSAWGDYDNDGWLDLCVSSAYAPNLLLHNETGGGELLFGDASEAPFYDHAIGGGVSWGDSDGDGDLDVLIADVAYWFPSQLIRNDGQTGAFLHVDLVGTVSNRSAIGARIRIVDDGLSQIRELSGATGFCAQNSLTAEFGLGPTATDPELSVDLVEIHWPSGIVQTFEHVAANQRITIVESSPTPALVDGTEQTFGLSARPNPFRERLTIQFSLDRAGRYRVEIFDVAGRRRATLADRVFLPGSHAIVWSGRDVEGRPVGDGVYFYRVAGEGRTATGRVVTRPLR